VGGANQLELGAAPVGDVAERDRAKRTELAVGVEPRHPELEIPGLAAGAANRDPARLGMFLFEESRERGPGVGEQGRRGKLEARLELPQNGEGGAVGIQDPVVLVDQQNGVVEHLQDRGARGGQDLGEDVAMGEPVEQHPGEDEAGGSQVDGRADSKEDVQGIHDPGNQEGEEQGRRFEEAPLPPPVVAREHRERGGETGIGEGGVDPEPRTEHGADRGEGSDLQVFPRCPEERLVVVGEAQEDGAERDREEERPEQALAEAPGPLAARLERHQQHRGRCDRNAHVHQAMHPDREQAVVQKQLQGVAADPDRDPPQHAEEGGDPAGPADQQGGQRARIAHPSQPERGSQQEGAAHQHSDGDQAGGDALQLGPPGFASLRRAGGSA
jgi:hypothetical protein